MRKRYSLDEIKQKFIRYRELKHSQITDDEYGFFCGALYMLTSEIVDSLDKDVDFVMLSAQPSNNPIAACTVFPPAPEDLKDKKPIIILTPIIFGFGIDWDKHGPSSLFCFLPITEPWGFPQRGRVSRGRALDWVFKEDAFERRSGRIISGMRRGRQLRGLYY